MQQIETVLSRPYSWHDDDDDVLWNLTLNIWPHILLICP